jgi:hypothetical protein
MRFSLLILGLSLILPQYENSTHHCGAPEIRDRYRVQVGGLSSNFRQTRRSSECSPHVVADCRKFSLCLLSSRLVLCAQPRKIAV